MTVRTLDGTIWTKPLLREVAIGYDNQDTTTPAANEVQTVTISGGPTGGTFTLSLGGQTTATIAYNAAASAVQSALQALSTIGSGNATVSGSAGGPYTVTFVGTLAAQDVAQMTANSSGLTGGTSPTVAVATTTPGTAGSQAIAYVVTDAAGVSRSPDAQELAVQGTTSKDKFSTTSSYAITLDQQRWVEALDEISLATATAPTGVATRYVGGNSPLAGYYEIREKYSQVNRETGAPRYYYLRWLKCNVKTADPSNAQGESVVAQQIIFEATQTTEDLLGVAIAGAPAEGIFYTKDILS